MKQLTIGNVSLANPVILAPMAGVSDLPFRLLCHEQGAGMVCSEMISAKAILYHNKNTEELMQIHPDEGPVSLQLFGSDPDIVSEMAKRIEERPFAVMDLNMGCPVPKVVKSSRTLFWRTSKRAFRCWNTSSLRTVHVKVLPIRR